MIKVSVIVPIYNSEEFLRECLESICNQTLEEIEIICVDDGSTDGSLNIVHEYCKKDSRIKLLYQDHKGGGAARNKGLTVAEGTYLSFLDSDDFFEIDMLEKAYLKAEKTNSDIIVYGVKDYHQATGAITHEPAGLRTEFLPEKEIFSWLDMPNYIFNTFHNWPWNKMFRREFILKNNIRFQEIFRTNDLLFTNKALILAHRISVIQEELIYYRVRVSGNCQSTNVLYPDDFYKAFLELKKFLIDKKIFQKLEKSFVNHALDGCMANLHSIEFSNAHKELFSSLRKGILQNLCIDCDKKKLHSSNYNLYLELDYILKGSYEEYIVYLANKYRNEYIKLQFDSYLNETKLIHKIKLIEEDKSAIKKRTIYEKIKKIFNGEH